MINPSVFFTDLKCSAIKHIPKLFTDSYAPCIACDCNRPKISAWKPEDIDAIDMPYRQVVLEPKTLMFKEQGIVFWTGLCVCETWYWHCKTWDWVGWMNDLQTCKMLLNTIPLQHILTEHNHGVAGISVHAGTRLFFENGKLTKIE